MIEPVRAFYLQRIPAKFKRKGKSTSGDITRQANSCRRTNRRTDRHEESRRWRQYPSGLLGQWIAKNIYMYTFCGMEKACFRTGGWRCCLSLNFVDFISQIKSILNHTSHIRIPQETITSVFHIPHANILLLRSRRNFKTNLKHFPGTKLYKG